MAVAGNVVRNQWLYPHLVACEKLGEGSFGSIWKAQHKTDGKYYAVKKISITKTLFNWKMKNGNLSDSFLVRKLLREVDNLTKIEINSDHIVKYNHSWTEGPNIEDLYMEPPILHRILPKTLMDDWSSGQKIPEGNDYFFIQMELCTGTLKQWMENPLNSTESRKREIPNILYQTSLALKALHDLNIIHRDLKPDNIFYKIIQPPLNSKKDPILLWKLGDFGLSTTVFNASENQASWAGCFTYRSPEMQKEDKDVEVDIKSDVFSLGLVFLEILHPFESIKSRNSCFINIANNNKDALPVYNKVRKEFFKEFEVLREMLHYRLDKRLTSAEVVAQFESYLKQINRGDRVVASDCLPISKPFQMITDEEKAIIEVEEPLISPHNIHLTFMTPTSCFISREDHLDNICDVMLLHQRKCLVISGNPEIGKTHLAIEFANYFLAAYEKSIVYWTQGETLFETSTVFYYTRSTYSNSFVARKLNFRLRSISQEVTSEISFFEKLKLIRKEKPKHKILFVVDDITIFTHEELKSLELSCNEFNLNGLILTDALIPSSNEENYNITTLVRNTGKEAIIIIKESSVLLLKPSLQIKLCNILECHPFAIQQAVASITHVKNYGCLKMSSETEITNFLDVYQNQKDKLERYMLDLSRKNDNCDNLLSPAVFASSTLITNLKNLPDSKKNYELIRNILGFLTISDLNHFGLDLKLLTFLVSQCDYPNNPVYKIHEYNVKKTINEMESVHLITSETHSTKDADNMNIRIEYVNTYKSIQHVIKAQFQTDEKFKKSLFERYLEVSVKGLPISVPRRQEIHICRQAVEYSELCSKLSLAFTNLFRNCNFKEFEALTPILEKLELALGENNENLLEINLRILEKNVEKDLKDVNFSDEVEFNTRLCEGFKLYKERLEKIQNTLGESHKLSQSCGLNLAELIMTHYYREIPGYSINSAIQYALPYFQNMVAKNPNRLPNTLNMAKNQSRVQSLSKEENILPWGEQTLIILTLLQIMELKENFETAFEVIDTAQSYLSKCHIVFQSYLKDKLKLFDDHQSVLC